MTPGRWLTVIVGIASCLCCGCAGKDESFASVSGQVTFHGLPAEAELIFEPREADGTASGRSSTAFTDDDGNFTLRQTAAQSGVAIGQHQISIKVFRWKGATEVGSFGTGVAAIKTVRLIRKVNPGNNQFDFPIGY